MNILILTIICFIITECDALVKTFTVGKRHVKVTGIGCVVVMFKGTNETNGITVRLDSVKEIQENGMEIGTVGGTTRSFTDFTRTTFKTISTESSLSYPGSTIDVDKIVLTTDLDIDDNFKTKLTVELIIFQGKGNMQVDGTGNIKVRGGDVKLDVMVEKWPFCGINNVVCDNGQHKLTGGFLDVVLSVMGQGTAAMKTTTTYALGGDGSYIKFLTDSSSTDMRSYPTLSMLSGKPMFTSRMSTSTSDNSAVLISMFSLGPDVDFVVFVPNIPGPRFVYAEKGKIADCFKQFYKTIATKLVENLPPCVNIFANTSNNMTVEFRTLEEGAVDGSKINRTADPKTLIDSDDTQTTFSVTNIGTGQFLNIDVNHTRLEFVTFNYAVLTVDIYIFLEDGTVNNDNETYVVEEGCMKFSIKISNWSFCGDPGVVKCTSVIPGFLYLDILIKGISNLKRMQYTNSNGGIVFQQDNNYWKLVLSKLVKKDDTYVQIADPVLSEHDNGTWIEFKFPKFLNMIDYDPIIYYSAAVSLSYSTQLVFISMLWYFNQ